jgi:hypothetical protein
VQTEFIALYRGQTVSEAQLIALTAEPSIVDRFFRELAGGEEAVEEPHGAVIVVPLVRAEHEKN